MYPTHSEYAIASEIWDGSGATVAHVAGVSAYADFEEGRVTDFLTRMDGKMVFGIVVVTYVITNLPGIRQVRFIQNEMRLGPEIEIRTEFRADIPFEKSGK